MSKVGAPWGAEGDFDCSQGLSRRAAGMVGDRARALRVVAVGGGA